MNPLLRLAPALLASSIVLTVFADSGEVLEVLVRPLVVAIGGAVAAQLLAVAVTRSWTIGSLVAVVAVLAIVTPLGAIGLAAVMATARLVSPVRGSGAVTSLVAVPVVLLFVIALARTATSPAFSLEDLATAEAERAPGHEPDIFVVLLDGYPRSDTLAELGYDNAWFEDALAERGFDVAGAAHSNYSWTYLVLPTTFHMTHASEIEELSPPPATRVAQRRAIRDALSATPVTTRLRELGYRIVSTGLPGSSLTLRDVDEYIDDGELSLFEHQVLERTALRSVTQRLVLDAYRDRVRGGFEAIEEVAEDPASTFLFAHLLTPHVPFVFDRDGDMPRLSCWPDCDSYRLQPGEAGVTETEFNAALVDQVHYVNGRTLQAIDEVIARSPDARIVLFSDHGARVTEEPTNEWFSTFFAARTPEHPDLYGDDARPIELFPRLFNAYFGDELAIAPDVTFASPQRNRLPLTTTPYIGNADEP